MSTDQPEIVLTENIINTSPATSVPPTPSSYDWGYVLDIAQRHKQRMIGANMVAILATVFSVPVPLLMPLLVDEVLLEQPAIAVDTMNHLFPAAWHGPVLYILGLLLLTLFLRGMALLLNVVQTREFTRTAKDITYRMRASLLRRLQRISMAEYETMGSGAVSSHFITDMETIDHFIGTTVSRLLVAVLTIIGTAIVLLWMHWQVAIFILFLNPLVIYFTTVLGKRVKQLKKNENKAFEVFQQSLTETLDAIHQIRASNREQHYVRQLIDHARQVKHHSAAFSWKSDVASRLSFMVFLFGFDIFRAMAMLMVVYSDLSIGQMFAVFGYLWFMMGPVQEILAIQYAYYGAKAALGRVNSLLDLHEEPHFPHLHDPFAGKQTVGIRIDHVHFAYGNDQDVLNGLTLSIQPGEKVALVGASGGGKSTLVQVLLGLYPLNAGMIYFDNVPVTEIGLDVVRENVATVLQHPILFNATVRENLTLGRALDDAQLWEALAIAQLEPDIRYLKDGLNTVVGQHGIRLSGGQRQRLAIARMILSDPKVVILDEATSALDSNTEQRLHEAMSTFLKGRTTLIVAHRLSAVKQAQHVYVFEDGLIAEQGDHDTLIAQQGLYAKLYGH